MNVIYKHKETGTKVSLEEIKKHEDKKVIIYLNKCFEYKNGIFPGIHPSRMYICKDVPFSDDFEIVIENNELDLNYFELNYLLSLIDADLNIKPISEKINIRQKLLDILNHKIINNLR